MRIAVFSSSYPESKDDPSGHFVRAEVDELVALGHDVTVFCPGAKTSARPLSTSLSNPSVVRLGATSLFGWPGALSRLRKNPLVIWQLLPFVVRARRCLHNDHFDRVVGHWLFPCGWPILSSSGPNTEIVVHGSDARLAAHLPEFLRERLLGSLRARGHSLRFVATHLKPLLTTRNLEAWIMNSAVSPCALDLPPLPSRDEARRTLGLPDAGFVATLIGRLVPSKRIDVALERAQLPPGARVYVIGSGPCLPELKRRFEHVVFLGQLPRSLTLTWLKASDVLLNASLLDGAPTVVREARALAVPVWSAPSEAVCAWAATDPGISLRHEFARDATR